MFGTIKENCTCKQNEFMLRFTMINEEVELLLRLGTYKVSGMINTVNKIREINSKTNT